jgi:hypothetical protein
MTSRTTRATAPAPLRAGRCSPGSPPNRERPTGEADAILAALRDERQQRAERRGDLALRPLPGAEVHRQARVDEEHERELALLDVGLDERLAGLGRAVPIDRPHVVARLVGPHLLELDPGAAERAAVRAREHVVDHAVRPELDLAHASHQLGDEQVLLGRSYEGHGWSSACGSRQGTGTVSSTRATSLSLDKPSASAS